MEAPQLLKSRNKGSIQVRDEAAVRFVNADPTGALCHVGSRDLGGSSAGRAGGGVAGRPPGPSRARGALCALRPVSLHLSPSAFRIRHMSPRAHLPRAARRGEGDRCYHSWHRRVPGPARRFADSSSSSNRLGWIVVRSPLYRRRAWTPGSGVPCPSSPSLHVAPLESKRRRPGSRAAGSARPAAPGV